MQHSANPYASSMRRLTTTHIALEALTNARDLFDDGLVLYERQRISSAFTLIGLAADELGKHILVASFYGAREDTDAEWKKFWQRFRRHQEKLGNSLYAAWAGDLLSDEAPPDAELFHKQRLAATYVDIDDNDLVQTPRTSINKNDVAHAIERIGSELDFVNPSLKAQRQKAWARLSNPRGPPTVPPSFVANWIGTEHWRWSRARSRYALGFLKTKSAGISMPCPTMMSDDRAWEASYLNLHNERRRRPISVIILCRPRPPRGFIAPCRHPRRAQRPSHGISPPREPSRLTGLKHEALTFDTEIDG